MTTNDDTLVLIPGLMCDHAVWDPVLPALRQTPSLHLGAVHIADHRTAGSLLAMAAQVLQSVPGRLAVAGHSMGGRVALEVWRQAPQRVARLALLDTGCGARPAGVAGEAERDKRMALLALARREGVRAMAAQWVQGMVHPARLGDRPLVDAILDMFERRSADIFALQLHALLDRPEAGDALASVDVPLCIGCGAQDSWAPVAQHEAMVALNPRARLEVVADAGHMAPMERPAEMAALLGRWLQQD
jgi:pimeloyl-ACP methyl ester carboxylesterase